MNPYYISSRNQTFCFNQKFCPQINNYFTFINYIVQLQVYCASFFSMSSMLTIKQMFEMDMRMLYFQLIIINLPYLFLNLTGMLHWGKRKPGGSGH